MPRRRLPSVRRACSENAGNIMFFRRRNYKPCICIKLQEARAYDISGTEVSSLPVWGWVPFDQLDSVNFMRYRGQIAERLHELQDGIRSQDTRIEREIIYHPSPMERVFLQQLFNNHLTIEEKKRYIAEFSNTIIGAHTCIRCLGFSPKGKKKCLHYDCPGMCKRCYDEIDDHCPTCKKEQKMKCPICLEEKMTNDLCYHGNSKHLAQCGHPVCWICLGKAYSLGKPLTECPLCRASWVSTRVLPQPPVALSPATAFFS